jgi:putative transposase
MYNWRKMSDEERQRALEIRRARKLPWHSPPHLDFEGVHQYLISSACYEHAPIIGRSGPRLTECEEALLEVCRNFCLSLYAWCILPNHYHAVVKTDRIRKLRHALGQLHGRSSFRWNSEDAMPGRKVWHNCFERPIKSKRHFWATLNYVHHNPVHHGYVDRWQDWPWSSAAHFIKVVGRPRALELWLKYPILDYGKKWDR